MMNLIHKPNVCTQNSYVSVQCFSINKHLVWPGAHGATAAGSHGSMQVPCSAGASDAHTKKLFSMKEVRLGGKLSSKWKTRLLK